jgi:cyclin-dependent kinase 7
LLISQTGHLKLADFGLASTYAVPYVKQTSQVVTRWYRAPELLLGSRHYGPGIDIWASGCIFAELMLRTPYLPADSDASQLDMCFRALGTPTEAEWPGMRALPGWTGTEEMRPKPMGGLGGTFSAAGEDALVLLGGMLRFDPVQRPSALEVLRSRYFENLPRPTRAERLPRKGDMGAVADTLKRKGEEGLDAQPVKKVYV